MVKIVDFKKRENEMGSEFNLLILEGGIEAVTSSAGNVYFTSRKAGVPCTFNEEKCQELIGEQLPGSIKKIPSEPYEYTIPESGEKVILNHMYQYQNEAVSIEDNVFAEDEELIV